MKNQRVHHGREKAWGKDQIGVGPGNQGSIGLSHAKKGNLGRTGGHGLSMGSKRGSNSAMNVLSEKFARVRTK